MRFHILTLFPDFFTSVLSATMLQKAQERGVVQFALVNVRDFATDKHHVTDDTPYGGGHGMVMKPDPLVAALESVAAAVPSPATPARPQSAPASSPCRGRRRTAYRR